jgi:hypothetical protein
MGSPNLVALSRLYHPALATIRLGLLRYGRRSLFCGFSKYLTVEFGTNWAVVLRHCRALCVQSACYSEFWDKVNALLCHQGGINSNLDPTCLMAEATRGREVFIHFMDSTWWEWSRGSALVFWRWSAFKQLALDGCVPWLLSPLPTFRRRPMVPPPSN